MEEIKINDIICESSNAKFIVKGRIKPFPTKFGFEQKYIIAVLFDKTSSIEIRSFVDCDTFLKQLNIEGIISIENFDVKSVLSTLHLTSNHKFKIYLTSTSKITIINNEEINDDFPIHQYISGSKISKLDIGTFIDILGICIKCDIDKTSIEKGPRRLMRINVNDTEVLVVMFGYKANIFYKEDSILSVTNAQLCDYKGITALIVSDRNLSHIVVNYKREARNSISGQQLKTEKKVLQDLHSENDPPDSNKNPSTVNLFKTFNFELLSESDKYFVGSLMHLLNNFEEVATVTEVNSLKRQILETVQSEKMNIICRNLDN